MILRFPRRQFNMPEASAQELDAARIEVQAWNEEIYHAWHRQDKDAAEHFRRRRDSALDRIEKSIARVEMIQLYKKGNQ